eukprot:scaffold3132_cov127-Skeletonema_marinoi.AAC.2
MVGEKKEGSSPGYGQREREREPGLLRSIYCTHPIDGSHRNLAKAEELLLLARVAGKTTKTNQIELGGAVLFNMVQLMMMSGLT